MRGFLKGRGYWLWENTVLVLFSGILWIGSVCVVPWDGVIYAGAVRDVSPQSVGRNLIPFSLDIQSPEGKGQDGDRGTHKTVETVPSGTTVMKALASTKDFVNLKGPHQVCMRKGSLPSSGSYGCGVVVSPSDLQPSPLGEDAFSGYLDDFVQEIEEGEKKNSGVAFMSFRPLPGSFYEGLQRGMEITVSPLRADISRGLDPRNRDKIVQQTLYRSLDRGDVLGVVEVKVGEKDKRTSWEDYCPDWLVPYVEKLLDYFHESGKPMNAEVTAYHEPVGKRTASGKPVDVGVAAVDPSVIPMGKWISMPSYKYNGGCLQAADTGGKVKGNIIDAFVMSEEEAEKWGRRNVKVRIFDSKDACVKAHRDKGGMSVVEDIRDLVMEMQGSFFHADTANVTDGGRDPSSPMSLSVGGSQHPSASPQQSTPQPGSQQSTPQPGPQQSTPQPGPQQSTPQPGPQQSTPQPGPQQSTPQPGSQQSMPQPGSQQQSTSQPGSQQSVPQPESQQQASRENSISSDGRDRASKGKDAKKMGTQKV
ncbi:3D domain-containing protein [Pasteuria penetrans]|uniref:3D domain-containing protein n=1 Tax=Pasteuria penetrans TaxID=86005 RepID=UPI000F98D9C1|nr:3D domain-containing protein [Pasteuria penetrans]